MAGPLWRVTAQVRDQGTVGTCWAFSTVGAVESQRALAGDLAGPAATMHILLLSHLLSARAIRLVASRYSTHASTHTTTTHTTPKLLSPRAGHGLEELSVEQLVDCDNSSNVKSLDTDCGVFGKPSLARL